MAENPEVTEGREAPGGSVERGVRASAMRVWRVLEFSAAYLAVIAAVDVFIVMYLLSLPPSPAPLVGALVTFAIYANDRLVDLETDAISSPDRAAFVERHADLLYVLAALAYGLAAVLAALGGPLAFALTLLPGAVWVVYAVDWVRLPEVDVTRLKQLPVVSSVLVAVAWALPVVVLPIMFADAALTPTVGVLFVYFALGAFLSTEVSNVYDIETDAANDVVTLPTMLGVRQTRVVLSGVALLAAAVPAVAVVADYLHVRAALLLAVGVVAVTVGLSVLHRFDRGRVPTLIAEATHLPVPVAIAVLALV
jgi:4-hydroxybenzoate polyprenyltransferase